MTRISLHAGSYSARSPASAAQRMLNLYSEPLPPDVGEPAPVAEYPTPGLISKLTLPTLPIRGIHAISIDNVGIFGGGTFVMAGNTLYFVDSSWVATALIIAPGALTSPVSMADNGLILVMVDGTAAGYTVDLFTHAAATISDPAFYGADKVVYLDTYFLFNRPKTSQFYWTTSNAIKDPSTGVVTYSNLLGFPPLNIAAKTTYPDKLVSIIVAKRELWLIGARSTEIWYDSGASDSAFERVPGVFIDQGCAALYSVATIDNAVFWVSQNRQGAGIVLQGEGYEAKRISTFAVENAIAALNGNFGLMVGWTYQLGGHTCYVLTLNNNMPSWVYDLATGKWHEWSFSGAFSRHRGQCSFQANGVTAVGDWQNGIVYALSAAALDDAGTSIQRQRVFPHIEGDDGNRLAHTQFIANMSCGNAPGGLISLSWSDDRGVTYGTPVSQNMGTTGQTLFQMQWQRLGMARSRTYSLTWSAAVETVLLGAFVDVTPSIS